MSHSWSRAPFLVSTDTAKFDLDAIHGYLARSYWSPQIPREIVVRAIEKSLGFGLYHDSVQIGFARVISDHTTFAYLADVFVLEEWRGLGLSKFMMECIKSHPDLQHLRRWMLATADAHGLYAQFGFQPLARPADMMEIVDREIYQRMAATKTPSADRH